MINPLAIATDGLILPPGGGGAYTPEQIRAALGLPGPDLGARLGAIHSQLVADWRKGEDRYTRYLPGTTTVILDKDVSFDRETGFTVTQREQ